MHVEVVTVNFPLRASYAPTVTHIDKAEVTSVYAGCNKSYRQPGDLNAHTKTHYTSLMTCKHCDYSTHDKRNLKSHLRKHTQVCTFCCKQCNHKFTHTMQLIRHRPKCEAKKEENASGNTHDP